jgi:uncharacterized protein YdhG (YjbR/CyaY superfamily)
MRSGKAAKTVEEYLSTVSNEQRVALEKLRKTIRSAAPKAEECISYGMPTFKQNGMLVCFGAFSNHCSFFPGAKPIETHKAELKNFETSKGTIHFQPDNPIPATLIKTIVKERIADNELRAARKKR